MQVIARTHVGKVRPINEDGFWFDIPGGLFLVADGMGGHEAGEVASALAVQTLADCWQGQPVGAEPVKTLLDACQKANRAIFEQAQTHSSWSGMGTTLTALWSDGSQVVIAHVGDSRAYRINEHGVTPLTHDHSLVEEMIRQGTLTEAEAQGHPQRNVITRALGTRDTVKIDVFTEALAPQDVLLLCTDGLSNLITDEEIGKVLSTHQRRSSQQWEQAADQLLALALERGGFDNITFLILVQTESEGWNA
ncbi:Stp1/IreP family PP2C-type Ser/Thr phosphatase [Heliophilum fasciatum]|uniref:Protein phosphatase n=1 Tax=Heliophilum fasciatum TaxID=35700 RepID=A0A4R2S702_9FIRM|nr:Stp1/IreP family PP2C-type Ser/Thr phosphatase [Heliophilum fasciatum]MCW2277204.1 protein phosphatase [Heliophilum fasciatum]TCP68161.1 protein phosphatase [Heliophilum fasciatum]